MYTPKRLVFPFESVESHPVPKRSCQQRAGAIQNFAQEKNILNLLGTQRTITRTSLSYL